MTAAAQTAALTVAEIGRLVKDEVDNADLAARIRASRLHDIIGTQGLRIGTHYVAGLSGSELAQLHEEGASAEVLDALQQKFLAEFIEFDRMRYQSWGKGPGRSLPDGGALRSRRTERQAAARE